MVINLHLTMTLGNGTDLTLVVVSMTIAHCLSMARNKDGARTISKTTPCQTANVMISFIIA